MKPNRKARIVIAVLVVGAIVMLAALSLRHSYDALLVMADLVHVELPLPDSRPEVLRRDMSYRLDGQEHPADLYVDAAGPRAGLVLVPGAAPEGRADPRLVEFAHVLARSGFAVLVPDIPSFRELRPSPESTREIGAAFASLRNNVPLPARGKLGIVAFSLAAGAATLAALDPTIADRVGFLLLVGGYHDLERTLAYMTTGYYEVDGQPHYREPDAYGKWVHALSNANRLPDPAERAVFTALARRKLEAPDAAIDDLLAQLGPAGNALYDFVTNTDPERVSRLIRDLPPGARSDIAALDLASRDLSGLRAMVILVHGFDDNIIPYTESVSLAAALPPGRARLFLLRGLHHVDRDFDALDTWRTWRVMKILLSQRG